MLTARCMRNGAGYARKHLEKNDYWAEGEKVCGQWFGRGAEKLGLIGQVELEQFEWVRQGCHPETGEQIRQRIKGAEQGRNLYDFTLSAPKSISLMAILANDTRLTEAHDAPSGSRWNRSKNMPPRACAPKVRTRTGLPAISQWRATATTPAAAWTRSFTRIASRQFNVG